ncbi:MAG: recombination protein NinG, partial [Candidatus Nanopelagicaceae bacterium]
MEYKIKPRRCKVCNEVFTPNRPLVPVCSPKCAIEYT